MFSHIAVPMTKTANQPPRHQSPLFLKEWRKAVGKRQGRRVVPQEELAAEAGITGSQVSFIETGVSDTKLGTLVRIADALGVEVRDLFRHPDEVEERPTLPPAVRSIVDLMESLPEEDQWAMVTILETWVRRAPKGRD